MAEERHGQWAHKRTIYGRHKGHRLRAGQSALLESLLPSLRLDLRRPAPAPAALFSRPVSEIHLEIGFGGGEHLAHEARSQPITGFIGCEPFVNGVAKLLATAKAESLENIRVHDGDAREVLDWLPAASLARIWLLYPDPWPKRRHAKRRFVNEVNLDALARVLRGGGELRFASDWPDYVDWTLRHVSARADFAWTAERADDWRSSWPGWPGTRYEDKAMREGRMPSYLTFRRV